MKTYFVVRIGNGFTVMSVNLYLRIYRETKEAFGDEIVGEIQAPSWEKAWESAKGT